MCFWLDYVDKDPYQMSNVYAQADSATKQRLHGMLQAYFECVGSACP